MSTKNFYYKLGEQATVYYDPTNKLKVTTGVPGKTTLKTKQTKLAASSGHIQEISEKEYNDMLDELPEATKQAILSDGKPTVVKKKVVKVVEEEEEEKEGSNTDDEDEERLILLEQLESLDLNKKDLKRISKLSNEEIKEYLENN